MNEYDYKKLKINDFVVNETNHFSKLTIGKKYMIINLNNGWIKVKNDEGENLMYHAIHFIKLNEYVSKQRKMKINKIYGQS